MKNDKAYLSQNQIANKENIISNKHSKSKKTHSTLSDISNANAIYHNPTKRTAQLNATALKHVLNLIRPIKWIFHEWFYSNLDQPLLLGENYFKTFLNERLPQLKTRKLSKGVWSLIRSLMGRPRRCSTNFFAEERLHFNDRRNLVRRLQQKRPVEPRLLAKLPDDFMVPMPLIMDTKVFAKACLRLEKGRIHGVNVVDKSYFILFENTTLGSQLVPDYDVLSTDPQTMIPITAFKTEHKTSRKIFNNTPRLLALPNQKNDNNANKEELMSIENCELCSSDTIPGLGELNLEELSKNSNHHGGYPVKLLLMTTKFAKLLQVKNAFIEDMKSLNDRGQWKMATEGYVTPEFQYRYANTVLRLESLNKQIAHFMAHTVQFIDKIAQENGYDVIEQPIDIRRQCDILSFETINKVRNANNYSKCSPHNLDLVSKMVSSLCQVRTLTESSECEHDCTAIRHTVADILSSVAGDNRQACIDNIQVPMNTIVSDMDRKSELTLYHYLNPLIDQLE